MATKSTLRAIPKPTGRPVEENERLKKEIKKADQEFNYHRREMINAKERRERALARLLEDVDAVDNIENYLG